MIAYPQIVMAIQWMRHVPVAEYQSMPVTKSLGILETIL